MNVLVVTAYPPVLHSHGGGVRMYHNIRILARQHRVRVISFVDSDEDQDVIRTVGSVCESVTAVRRTPDFRPHWLSVMPFLVREFSTPAMYRAIAEAFRKEKVDVLQCEYLQMAQFRRPGVFCVLTAHETLSKNTYDAFLRAGDPLEKVRLFYRWMQMMRYEVLQTRKFDRVVTMTENDARYLRSYSPAADIRAIPIGIDPEEFSPFPEDVHRPIEVVFLGNFRHTPNVEAASFLVRHVAPRFPEMRFVIPGSHAPPELMGGPNVSFPGYVADARQLYRRPNVVVMAPLFSGTGQRVKLLEAFAMACPVVTTTVGAMGFPVRHGEEALISNTVDEFCDALGALAVSVEYRRSLGERGRRMIVERFGWDRLGEDLLRVVEESVVSN